jgi:hypothetical protein
MILKYAYSLQRQLRWASVASLGYPFVCLGLYIADLFPLTTIIASTVAAIIVCHIHAKHHGPIANWWWLRRGYIMAVGKDEDLEEVRQWLREGNLDWKEVYPSCFKFFDKGGATLFKLTWG